MDVYWLSQALGLLNQIKATMKPTTGVVSFEENLSFPVFRVYFLLGLGGDFPTFDTFFCHLLKIVQWGCDMYVYTWNLEMSSCFGV